MRSLLVVALLASTASADVDWTTGRLLAVGVGLADRQAPNPAVARGTAKRKAEESARTALRSAATTVPLAGGGTFGDKLGDKVIAQRFEHALAGALSVTAEPQTDGAWVVTLALPTEAIRQAIVGPRSVPPTGDGGPAVVIVEGAKAVPGVGYTIGGVAAATLFVKAVPAWAKGAPTIKAKGTSGVDIDAPLGKTTPATLFVITY